MAEFYSARGWEIPPLPWTNLSPPFGHGLYQADLKCDENGTPHVTEINIGRFPQTSTHFDRVGRYRMLELYLALILRPQEELPRNVYDLDPGKYVLRGIDMPVMFVDASRVEEIKRNRM